MKINSPHLRIVLDIVILIALVFTPWWVTVILAVIGLFLYSNYVEIILWFLALDMYFTPPHFTLAGIGILTISALIALPLVAYLKQHLVFYTR